MSMHESDEAQDPGLRKAFDQRVSRFELAPRWLPKWRLRRWVRLLGNTHRAWEAEQRLVEAGAKAVPVLLEALAGGGLGLEVKGTDSFGHSQFSYVVGWLRELAPEESLPFIVPLAAHENRDCRGEAVLALATLGFDECTDAVSKALNTWDQDFRGEVLDMISFGFPEGRGPLFRERLFPLVVDLLVTERSAPSALLALDQERAVQLLTAQSILRKENPNLDAVIQALELNEIPVPPEQMLSLLEQLQVRAAKGLNPECMIYADALALFAQSGHPSVPALCREAVHWHQEGLSESAAERLCLIHGIDSPQEYINDLEDRDGLAGLSSVQRVFREVSSFHLEVTNTGFDLYLSCVPDAEHRITLDGLMAIGARQDAALLRRAMELCATQAARDQPEQAEQLEQLEREYSREANPVHVLLLLFAVDHADEFCDVGGS